MNNLVLNLLGIALFIVFLMFNSESNISSFLWTLFLGMDQNDWSQSDWITNTAPYGQGEIKYKK